MLCVLSYVRVSRCVGLRLMLGFGLVICLMLPMLRVVFVMCCAVLRWWCFLCMCCVVCVSSCVVLLSVICLCCVGYVVFFVA